LASAARARQRDLALSDREFVARACQLFDAEITGVQSAKSISKRTDIARRDAQTLFHGAPRVSRDGATSFSAQEKHAR
jgi:hypothetical protein